MANCRQFLVGLLATGLAPLPTWADAGAPDFLAAAAQPDGTYVLCGINAARDIVFQFQLPARGHAAAAHPTRPEAVAFARRPGTFAVVVDCMSGAPKATLHAPKGRHFYGHGAFSQDGTWLFTTENDYEAGTGRIGVWDATNGYQRTAEFSSGGIGPHDLKRLPGTDTLAVGNGGIDTHPDSGRLKLNIPTMAPNLAYIHHDQVVETSALAPELHKNSIRHLAVRADGTVAIGMQWQDDIAAPPLVGTYQRGQDITLLSAPAPALRRMESYVGSIAYTADGGHIVATSPRGGIVQHYDARTQTLTRETTLTDVCGVAASTDGVMVSSGNGLLAQLSGSNLEERSLPAYRWDNHLLALSPVA